MIAVDTNVLVRLLVADDEDQLALAERLLETAREEGTSCFVSDPVLCELEWVLVSRYRARRSDVAAVFEGLVEDAGLVFENREALLMAIRSYKESRADLSEHLIGAKAHAFGAATTWTFDRALGRCPGFSLLR
jgi:predicted nucleic-acid-binding protein